MCVCVERECRVCDEDEGKEEHELEDGLCTKMKCINEMNMSYIMHCVLEECINNKFVPEIHFVALLKLKAPARTISVEITLALNPWCFGAKVVYVHTPGPHPPHCKAIHDSLSVLPKLEKIQEM